MKIVLLGQDQLLQRNVKKNSLALTRSCTNRELKTTKEEPNKMCGIIGIASNKPVSSYNY